MGWDGMGRKISRSSHRMGRKIFEEYPIPWDKKFLKSIPFHGVENFLR
jgi:hypothetical protein